MNPFSDVLIQAILELEPYFGIECRKIPSLRFCLQPQFISETNEVWLPPYEFHPALNETLGHELGHCLHDQIFSCPEYGIDMLATNYSEFIAQFSGFLLQDVASMELKRCKARCAHARALPEWANEDVDLSPAEDFLFHEGGCRAGSWAYYRFGPDALAELARLTPSQTQERLREEGYPYPLYIRFDKEEFRYRKNARGRIYKSRRL